MVNDDFDKDNDQWEPVPKSPKIFKNKSEFDEDCGTVTGLDVKGIIRMMDSTAVPQLPDDMLQTIDGRPSI